MSNHKIAAGIPLMREYLEEGYDAELIGRLNKKELASLIVCPSVMVIPMQMPRDEARYYHFDQIVHLAKEALLALVLEEIANND